MIAAVLTQKGGVGKTTFTYHIGVGLAREGMNVLMVDGDGQAHLSKWALGGPENVPDVGFAEVVEGKATLREAIVPTDAGPDLLPGHPRLNRTSDYLAVQTMGELVPAERMEGVEKVYDLVLVDCAPNAGKLNMGVLAWAQSVFLIADLSPMGIDGVLDQLALINASRKRLRNPDLRIAAVIPNNSSRTNASKGALTLLRERLGPEIGRVVTKDVRYSVVLKECPAYHTTIWESGARGSGPRADMNQMIKDIQRGLSDG